jgi:hypothetical protein
MRIKKGVDLSKIQPQMSIAAQVVEDCYGGYDCTITSGCEWVEHRREDSLHYSGLALDFRLRNIPTECTRERIAERTRNALPDDYDVVLSGKNAPCLHVEWDPK